MPNEAYWSRGVERRVQGCKEREGSGYGLGVKSQPGASYQPWGLESAQKQVVSGFQFAPFPLQ